MKILHQTYYKSGWGSNWMESKEDRYVTDNTEEEVKFFLQLQEFGNIRPVKTKLGTEYSSYVTQNWLQVETLLNEEYSNYNFEC